MLDAPLALLLLLLDLYQTNCTFLLFTNNTAPIAAQKCAVCCPSQAAQSLPQQHYRCSLACCLVCEVQGATYDFDFVFTEVPSQALIGTMDVHQRLQLTTAAATRQESRLNR